MSNQIDQIMKKTQQYWYVDGLAEIGMGGLFLFLGLAYLGIGFLPWQGVRALLLGLGMPLVILAGIVAVRWFVSQAKERITYPRTGYIEYRKPKTARRWILMVVSGVVSAGLIALLINFMPVIGDRFVMAMTGVMVFFLMSLLAFRVSVWRFVLVGLAALVGGLLGTFFDLPDAYGSALFFGSFGTAWMISGVLTLRNYLTKTHPVQEQDNE